MMDRIVVAPAIQGNFLTRHIKALFRILCGGLRTTPHTRFLYSTSGSASSIKKHNKALRKLGIDMVYHTFPHNIEPAVYAGMLRSPIARGAAVTAQGGMKTNIIPHLDWVEPLAQKTQAVNTVVNRNGKLYGYNTDALGLKTALERGIRESGREIKTAVIYGNGGVSGVAYHVLKDLGIRVTMVGRNSEKVTVKKHALGIADSEHFGGPYDLVVDATPVSGDQNRFENAVFHNPSTGEANPLSDLLNSAQIIFSHNMPEKDGNPNYLQAHAEQKEIYFIPGKWMYVKQMVMQFGLYLDGLVKPDGTPWATEADIIEAWGIGK